jgi:hypothetical protein
MCWYFFECLCFQWASLIVIIDYSPHVVNASHGMITIIDSFQCNKRVSSLLSPFDGTNLMNVEWNLEPFSRVSIVTNHFPFPSFSIIFLFIRITTEHWVMPLLPWLAKVSILTNVTVWSTVVTNAKKSSAQTLSGSFEFAMTGKVKQNLTGGVKYLKLWTFHCI